MRIINTRAARPRLETLLVAPALLGLLVACGSGGGGSGGSGGTPGASEPADPAPTVSAPAADFSATLDVQDGSVRVSYRFVNASASAVLVVQGPPGTDGQQDDARPVFVTGDGDTVVLSRRAFATPDPSDVDFAQAPRVGATEVGPGQEVSGEVTLALPLQRVHPYGDDLGRGPIGLPDPAAGVRFCLGVLAPPYPPAISRRPDDSGTTIAHGNTTNASQHRFCSDVEPLP